MNLSDMRAMVAEAGVRLTRARGQNFLHDRRQLDRILALAGLSSGDRVLEIGAGLGQLTELLVEAVPEGRVIALELDGGLAALTRGRLGDASNLVLCRTDALRWLSEEHRDWGEWKTVSNLPYSVASPLLVELAQAEKPPLKMVVTLQREVAERVVAGPGSKDYGVLTLLLQLRFQGRMALRIPSSCFWPEPEVDSACVVLDRRAEPLLEGVKQGEVFTKLVRRAFSQRRKMIPKLLRQDWPGERLDTAMRAAGVDPKARAEHVSLEQYVRMVKELVPRDGTEERRTRVGR